MIDRAVLELLTDLRDIAAEARDAQLRAINHTLTLIEEIRGLRRDLGGERGSGAATLSSVDIAALTAAVPVIHAFVGTDAFAIRPMLNEAATAKTPAARALLRMLKIAGIGDNAKRLGRLCQRAASADAEIAGLYLQRIGDSRDGATFCVVTESRESRIEREIFSQTSDTPRL